jgi:hypothetical protein
MMKRYQCDSCYKKFEENDLLKGKNPFDPKETVWGCPNCIEPVGLTLTQLCDEPGCEEGSGCGWNDTSGRRQTCYKHMGEHIPLVREA